MVRPDKENETFKVTDEAYSGPGIIINSSFLDGLKAPNDSVIQTIKLLEEKNWGKNKSTLD